MVLAAFVAFVLLFWCEVFSLCVCYCGMKLISFSLTLVLPLFLLLYSLYTSSLL